jgi:hypothetical protein
LLDSDQAFYLGPLLIGNSSHPETMKIVESVDVPVTTYTPESSWIFNWTTGETWPAPETPQTPPPEFLEELQRYTVQWQRVYGQFAGRTITVFLPRPVQPFESCVEYLLRKGWFKGERPG